MDVNVAHQQASSSDKSHDSVSEITFNNGEMLAVGEGDIVVFVGPNNAGKSQSLKDMYGLCGGYQNGMVIKSLKLTKSPACALQNLLKEIAVDRDQGDYKDFEGYRFAFNSYQLAEYDRVEHFGFARDILVSNLDTESRLVSCHAASAITRLSPKQHPIHYAAFDYSIQERQSLASRKAFGVDLVPDTFFGAEFPMRMGTLPSLDESIENPQERVGEYGRAISQLRRVDEQGDGIRSFVGVLLSLSIPHFRILLIDEPESFLHPPQAFIMGRTIGELLGEGKQAFISTHSQDVVKGLLEECPNRVKIVRITRDGDCNQFNILGKEAVSEICNDPLLKHSDILNGMFHRELVLCESDGDCKFYSVIDSAIKEDKESYSETMFMHCGGKSRMKKVSSILRKLGLSFHVVVDIDALNNEQYISELFNSCGGDWTDLEKPYRVLSSGLEGQGGYPNRREVKAGVLELLEGGEEERLSKNECETARRLFVPATKWSQLKTGGVGAVPGGDCRTAFDEINEALNKHGVHLVPCGELERFVPQVGGHGPEWVNNVFDKYPDLKNSIYYESRRFVESWGL